MRALGGSQGLLARAPVDRDSRQSWDVSNPPSVVLTGELDLKVERFRLNRLFHRFKLSITELPDLPEIYPPTRDSVASIVSLRRR